MAKKNAFPAKLVYSEHKTPKELKVKVYAHEVDDALKFKNKEVKIRRVKRWVYSKDHTTRL